MVPQAVLRVPRTATPVAVAGVNAWGYGHGQVSDPIGLAISPEGDLFTSSIDNEIAEFASAAGGSYSPSATVVAGTQGAGTTGALSDPNGVAFAANGDLFVGNKGEDDVLEYAYGRVLGYVPRGGNCCRGTTGQAGGAADEMNSPSGCGRRRKGRPPCRRLQ